MKRHCPVRMGLFFSVLLAVALLLPSGLTAQQPQRPSADDPPGKTKSGKSKKRGKKKKKKKKSKKRSGKKKLKAFPKGPREKEFAEELGEDYRVRYTDHFFVMYNADEEIIKDFIHRLELTYKSVHRFASQLDIKIEYPKEKLPVLFCSDFDEYTGKCKQLVGRDAPAGAAGLYFRYPANFCLFYDMSQVSFVKERTEKARKLKEEARAATDRKTKRAKIKEAQWYLNRVDQYQQRNNRSVVQHEVAHALLFNLQVHKMEARNPQWFVEGMATLFEPPPSKMGAGFNVINQHQLGELRESTLIKNAEDLRGFIGNPSGGASMLSTEGYATSWALTYYLVKRKRKELPRYIELIKSRAPDDEITPERELKDFEKSFGKVNEAFSRKWVKFIKGLPFRPPR